MLGSGYVDRLLQSGAVAIGVGNSITVTNLSQGAYRWLIAQIVAIGTATVTWEGTLDGATWVAIQAIPLGTGTAASTAAAAGLYRIDAAGLTAVRANITAWTSGPVTIAARVLAE